MQNSMEGSYWPTTDMEFQPQIHASNHGNLQNSGGIVDPWNTNAQHQHHQQQQQQSAITHLPQHFDMEVSSPYEPPSLPSAMSTNYQTDPYTYPHFPTNHADNYVYDVQQGPSAPTMTYAHSRFNLAPLPPNIPANLPHMIDEDHRVGLSEPWSEAGMRDMEAFERLCSGTNQFIRRRKPRKPNAKPIDGMPPNPSTSTVESLSTVSDQSFMTVQTEKTGCSPHVTVPDTMGNQTDGELVKPEYTTNPEPIVPYVPSSEPQYSDSVPPTEYSSIMAYPSTSTHHQSDLASSAASTMSSPHSESVGFSPVATNSMSPPLPPMTVPSQSPTSRSPTAARPTVRHAAILPAPSNRSSSTLTIDTRLTIRPKRNVSKSLLVGNSPDTLNDTSYQSGTNASTIGSSSKSPILNGPVPGSSQARTSGGGGAAESSKPASRSRRSATASGSNSNKSNNPAAATPDPPNALEHKLTETHSIPTADLDSFFQQSEQGCIGGRRAWMCPRCRKAVRKQDRASHKLSHEGKKRYDCACGKQFGRPQDADRHMREQAPCARCPGKMGRYGKDGLCSACVTEIEQGIGIS